MLLFSALARLKLVRPCPCVPPACRNLSGIIDRASIGIRWACLWVSHVWMERSEGALKCIHFQLFSWTWWSRGVVVFFKGVQKLTIEENKTSTGWVMQPRLPPSPRAGSFSSWLSRLYLCEASSSFFTIVSLCLIVQLSSMSTNLSCSYFCMCVLSVVLSRCPRCAGAAPVSLGQPLPAGKQQRGHGRLCP